MEKNNPSPQANNTKIAQQAMQQMANNQASNQLGSANKSGYVAPVNKSNPHAQNQVVKTPTGLNKTAK
jgi:hypothetical protein